jgi:hypothetical protein
MSRRRKSADCQAALLECRRAVQPIVSKAWRRAFSEPAKLPRCGELTLGETAAILIEEYRKELDKPGG